MDIIGNIKSLWDLLDRFLELRKSRQTEREFAQVMIAIYKLSNGEQNVVSYEQLLETGLRRLQILEAAKVGEFLGYLKRIELRDSMGWFLTLEGIEWVKGVLEEMGEQ